MPTSDSPIIAGRRNCAKCTRWRPVTDFRWRWKKRRSTIDPPSGLKTRGLQSRRQTPEIGTVCISCLRAGERDRYNDLTPEARKQRVHNAVEANKARRQKHRDQVHYAKMATTRRRKHKDDNEVELVPFRMWLLGRIRLTGSIRAVAREAGVNEKAIRRWAEGYDWDYEIGQAWASCEPRPIHSVHPSTVDRIGVALGEPDLLERLYPYVDKEEDV